MENLNTFWIAVLILLNNYSYSQIDSFSICNSFDSNITLIKIDTTSTWEIGSPTKSIFDSSYSGINSIITDLDSLYQNNDTSSFLAVYSDQGWVPNYLNSYLPLEIEFNHRFNTDSITDFGTIEMSFNGGDKWYDVLSDSYNAAFQNGYENYHYFEYSGDTIFDSLTVTGNSNGWVHSKLSKEIGQIISNDTLFYVDTILLKFTFISDSIGRNEGWQIDDLCIKMDYYFLSINEVNSFDDFKISPNPNNGNFTVGDYSSLKGQLEIFDVNGVLVYTEPNISNSSLIKTKLRTGLYFVKLIDEKKSCRITKLIVK